MILKKGDGFLSANPINPINPIKKPSLPFLPSKFSRFFSRPSIELIDVPMMRDRLVGVVGVLAEPEVGILYPLDMGVGLAGRVKMEIGIDVPGEKIARIASKEIQVGVTRDPQERGGDVLRYPADLRVEKFRDDVRLPSIHQGDPAVGLLASLEALADEQPRGNFVGATGGGKDEGESAAVGVQALAARGGVPRGRGRIGVTAMRPEIGVDPLAEGRGRLIVRAAQAGGIEPVLEGSGLPIDRFGRGEEFSRPWRQDRFRRGTVDELPRLEYPGDLDAPMAPALVALGMVQRGSQDAMALGSVSTWPWSVEVKLSMCCAPVSGGMGRSITAL